MVGMEINLVHERLPTLDRFSAPNGLGCALQLTRGRIALATLQATGPELKNTGNT